MVTRTQITIIDDDDSVRESLYGLIRSAGFAAGSFASAEEFLSSDSLERTQILILDVRMPGMDGLELQGRLREINCSIPIIFITAHDEEKARTLALRNGAIGFLLKPFSEEMLMAAIYAALKQRSREYVV